MWLNWIKKEGSVSQSLQASQWARKMFFSHPREQPASSHQINGREGVRRRNFEGKFFSLSECTVGGTKVSIKREGCSLGKYQMG